MRERAPPTQGVRLMLVRRVIVRNIEDLLSATGGNRDFRPVQMSRRDVCGELASTGAGDLTLTYGNFRSDIHVSGTWSNDKLTLGALLGARDARVFGESARPGDLLLAGRGREVAARYGDSLEYVAINVDRSDLLDVAGAHGWSIDPALLTGSGLLRPDERRASRLVARLKPVVGALRLGTLQPLGPAAARALAHDVLSEFARALSEQARFRDPGRRQNLVQRAEEWLLDDPSRTRGIREISQHFGVSTRQLFRAFQAEVGMSPAKYLKRYRMTQARLDLLGADPVSATVTQIATSWGFWELGRFAGEYRRLFEESPSETLQTFARDAAPLRSRVGAGTPAGIRGRAKLAMSRRPKADRNPRP